MVLGVSISRKKLSRKYVFHSERQWRLPKGVKAKDPGLQPFARSGRHFLLYLAHFIEAFLPQFLSHYERSFRGFYFDFYFLERLVASFNLTLLLLFENYNLKGRPRWVLVPNEDYDPTLPKETEPFKYKELKLKYWRRRLQPPKLPNEPMVIVKENSGQRRYLAGVRSFRIVEISAFNRNINFCMFGVKFFYKPPRKAIPLFIFSYFWINFRDFLILRTYFYHSYAQRYNELVAYVLGSRHYMRYPLVRPSRSFYFHHINIYHFYLVQFAIFFYFGHMIFLHVYQHPYVERQDPVLLYKGYKFYNKFFAILPLLRNPELWTMRRPLTKDTRYSVFFLESSQYYFLIFCYFIIQYSPKRYIISKIWINRWIHFFCMGSFFKIFLRSFGQKLYIGLLRKFVSNSLSNEFFYDWQLIDSFTVEQITNGWDSYWLRKILKIWLLDYVESSVTNFNFATFMTLFLHWEHLGLYYELPARFPRTLVIVMWLCFALFRLVPCRDFMPFIFLMYTPWALLNIDVLRDFFFYSKSFPNHFPRLSLDIFLRHYYFSLLFFFKRLLASEIRKQQRRHYKGRGRLPSRKRFSFPLRNYFYYFVARDVVFKFFFLSNWFPTVFSLLLDYYLVFLRRRKVAFLLAGEFSEFRGFFSGLRAKDFFPPWEEFFWDIVRHPHWLRAYELNRSVFFDYWTGAAAQPYPAKWLRVFMHDWRRARPVAASFYFMLFARLPREQF